MCNSVRGLGCREASDVEETGKLRSIYAITAIFCLIMALSDRIVKTHGIKNYRLLFCLRNLEGVEVKRHRAKIHFFLSTKCNSIFKSSN